MALYFSYSGRDDVFEHAMRMQGDKFHIDVLTELDVTGYEGNFINRSRIRVENNEVEEEENIIQVRFTLSQTSANHPLGIRIPTTSDDEEEKEFTRTVTANLNLGDENAFIDIEFQALTNYVTETGGNALKPVGSATETLTVENILDPESRIQMTVNIQDISEILIYTPKGSALSKFLWRGASDIQGRIKALYPNGWLYEAVSDSISYPVRYLSNPISTEGIATRQNPVFKNTTFTSPANVLAVPVTEATIKFDQELTQKPKLSMSKNRNGVDYAGALPDQLNLFFGFTVDKSTIGPFIARIDNNLVNSRSSSLFVSGCEFTSGDDEVREVPSFEIMSEANLNQSVSGTISMTLRKFVHGTVYEVGNLPDNIRSLRGGSASVTFVGGATENRNSGNYLWTLTSGSYLYPKYEYMYAPVQYATEIDQGVTIRYYTNDLNFTMSGIGPAFNFPFVTPLPPPDPDDMDMMDRPPVTPQAKVPNLGIFLEGKNDLASIPFKIETYEISDTAAFFFHSFNGPSNQFFYQGVIPQLEEMEMYCLDGPNDELKTINFKIDFAGPKEPTTFGRQSPAQLQGPTGTLRFRGIAQIFESFNPMNWNITRDFVWPYQSSTFKPGPETIAPDEGERFELDTFKAKFPKRYNGDLDLLTTLGEMSDTRNDVAELGQQYRVGVDVEEANRLDIRRRFDNTVCVSSYNRTTREYEKLDFSPLSEETGFELPGRVIFKSYHIDSYYCLTEHADIPYTQEPPTLDASVDAVLTQRGYASDPDIPASEKQNENDEPWILEVPLILSLPAYFGEMEVANTVIGEPKLAQNPGRFDIARAPLRFRTPRDTYSGDTLAEAAQAVAAALSPVPNQFLSDARLAVSISAPDGQGFLVYDEDREAWVTPRDADGNTITSNNPIFMRHPTPLPNPFTPGIQPPPPASFRGDAVYDYDLSVPREDREYKLGESAFQVTFDPELPGYDRRMPQSITWTDDDLTVIQRARVLQIGLSVDYVRRLEHYLHDWIGLQSVRDRSTGVDMVLPVRIGLRTTDYETNAIGQIKEDAQPSVDLPGGVIRRINLDQIEIPFRIAIRPRQEFDAIVPSVTTNPGSIARFIDRIPYRGSPNASGSISGIDDSEYPPGFRPFKCAAMNYTARPDVSWAQTLTRVDINLPHAPPNSIAYAREWPNQTGNAAANPPLKNLSFSRIWPEDKQGEDIRMRYAGTTRMVPASGMLYWPRPYESACGVRIPPVVDPHTFTGHLTRPVFSLVPGYNEPDSPAPVSGIATIAGPALSRPEGPMHFAVLQRGARTARAFDSREDGESDAAVIARAHPFHATIALAPKKVTLCPDGWNVTARATLRQNLDNDVLGGEAWSAGAFETMPPDDAATNVDIALAPASSPSNPENGAHPYWAGLWYQPVANVLTEENDPDRFHIYLRTPSSVTDLSSLTARALRRVADGSSTITMPIWSGGRMGTVSGRIARAEELGTIGEHKYWLVTATDGQPAVMIGRPGDQYIITTSTTSTLAASEVADPNPERPGLVLAIMAGGTDMSGARVVARDQIPITLNPDNTLSTRTVSWSAVNEYELIKTRPVLFAPWLQPIGTRMIVVEFGIRLRKNLPS